MNNNISDIFDANFIYIVPSNSEIIIEEKKEAGKGVCVFKSNSDALVLKAKDKAPLLWALKNKKCAEGAFLTSSSDGLTLHIVEMKSRLDIKEFTKVVEQFKGMYYSSLSVVSLCEFDKIVSIKLYLAFKRDLMNNSQQPILNKVQVGGAEILPIKKIWNSNLIPLSNNTHGHLIKGQRDGDDINFGYV